MLRIYTAPNIEIYYSLNRLSVFLVTNISRSLSLLNFFLFSVEYVLWSSWQVDVHRYTNQHRVEIVKSITKIQVRCARRFVHCGHNRQALSWRMFSYIRMVPHVTQRSRLPRRPCDLDFTWGYVKFQVFHNHSDTIWDFQQITPNITN